MPQSRKIDLEPAGTCKVANTIRKNEVRTMCRTMNQLESVVDDYRSLKALKDDLEIQLKQLEQEIIGYLDMNDKISETGTDFTVKVSSCIRRTLDSKRLEADLGDDLAPYFRVSNYRRLYVR